MHPDGVMSPQSIVQANHLGEHYRRKLEVFSASDQSLSVGV